jgi:hypothetical protein
MPSRNHRTKRLRLSLLICVLKIFLYRSSKTWRAKKKNGTFCDAKQPGFALTDHCTKRLRLSMLICILEVKEILHKDCEGWVIKKIVAFLF